VIGAAEDITSKKQIEAELKRSNERFNLMMQATNELLWEWNLETREIYRSPHGLKKVYGLDDESLVKTHEQWIDRVHPEDREKLQKSVEDIFIGGHMQRFESEYRFLNENGTYNYLYGCGILIADENGKPVRLIGTEQNITERKRLEQELLANELEYKKLINQATVDSQEQERSEIGRELHDNINQVLTTTKLYLELALGNRDMSEELLRKASQNISNAITEIRQLSRSLMDPAIGDLGIVDTIHDLIENVNLTKKIAVEVSIDASIEDSLEKKQKLTVFRIIQEALNNVIRHANATSVKISIKQQNNTIQLQIVDDGVGFNYISTKKGAGLKNITNRVYLINGHLQIDSKCGQGCRISITIPNRKTTSN
jgi:PAS domain S-box-containing protein